jgi:hypothetical protein
MSGARRRSAKRDADRSRPSKSWDQISLPLIGELGQLGLTVLLPLVFTANLIVATIGWFAAEDDDGHEGELKKLLVRHRKREHKFRAKKITDVMQRNDGHLICEVSHCGFDFHTQYGELGVGFVEVHHKKPLSQAPRRGQSIRLSDLAVVCANCHRIIHRHGQCRPLERLIPERKRRASGGQ